MINILHVQLLILSLTSMCSVKVSHTTDSVDPALHGYSQERVAMITQLLTAVQTSERFFHYCTKSGGQFLALFH